MKTAIQELGAEETIAKASAIADSLGGEDKDNLLAVLNACISNTELRPDLQSKKGNLTPVGRVERWVKKYYKGLEGRISKRISNLPSTTPDTETIQSILKARLPNLTDADCQKIIYAHRLSMSIENIQGLFLEEYLSTKMKHYGWHMAWGETIIAADMCSDDGKLLQIKSQDNTENSSSNKIRVGTEIHKWFRRKALTGETMWAQLCEIVGSPSNYMTESNYQAFIRQALTTNPLALAVEPENPWKSTIRV